MTHAFRDEWDLEPDAVYLNHGSFGPTPRVVLQAREAWSRRLAANPMRLLVRELDGLLHEAYEPLAKLINAPVEQLLWVDNATTGMNIAAASIPLSAGDEILVGSHEYGADIRIWERYCETSGARLVIQDIDASPESPEALIEQLFSGVTPRTRVLMVSHVTSCTGLIYPIEAICRRARELGLIIAVDGPHAPAAVPVDLAKIDCDFYAASCHKWMCGPIGSGFLYVAEPWKSKLRTPIVSWGRPPVGLDPAWRDEFYWLGTRDPAAFLAVPTAIHWLESIGLDRFREHSRSLCLYAREKLIGIQDMVPLVADHDTWHATMVSFLLPPGKGEDWMLQLAQEHGVECPIMQLGETRMLRVSCHLYNSTDDIDILAQALESL